jgi:methylenetetrahydrofolate dehydrogenase (NADP+)/methenyltetrahydrofolate cyclohydrolase
MIIVDGKKISLEILKKLKNKVSKMKQKPHLAVILVGEDKASETYVKNKQTAALEVGIRFSLYKYPEKIDEEKLVQSIKEIQKKDLDGIIVQLPLPKKFDKKKILNALDPAVDVDCLSWVSLGKIMVNEHNLVPPSPGAILEILNHYKIDLKGKHVVIVGQGDLIGKPLTNILVHLPVTLSICNKETKNLSQMTKQADILITGVGKQNLISANMLKPGVVVIDAGVSFSKGKIYGDINFDEVAKVASLVTPTPGGVGPITVAKLLENTVSIAETKK